jgi:3-oxoadipate enol-lactonase
MSLHPSTRQGVLETGTSTQPTMVLIHGLGVGAWMWRPQLSLFGEGYHTLAPDLPGFSQADSKVPFSMERAAQSILDLIRTSGKGPAHICGLSLGAVVALQAYQTEPEMVASLILSGGQVHPGRARMAAQRAIVRLLPERTIAGSMLPEVRTRHPELQADARAFADQLSKRGILTAMRALGRSDFRPLLPGIGVPTLVLCGADDRANLPASRLMAAAIPHAELQIIPGVGHLWNLEKPGLFGHTTLDFLQGVDSRRSAVPPSSSLEAV